MTLTVAEIANVATLARIKVLPEELENMGKEFSGIMHWIDQLQQINTQGVENYSDLQADIGVNSMPERPDKVDDGNCAEAVLMNAPEKAHDMFAVPKVVE